MSMTESAFSPLKLVAGSVEFFSRFYWKFHSLIKKHSPHLWASCRDTVYFVLMRGVCVHVCPYVSLCVHICLCMCVSVRVCVRLNSFIKAQGRNQTTPTMKSKFPRPLSACLRPGLNQCLLGRTLV